MYEASLDITILQKVNNKGADQTMQMGKLICSFVICLQQSQVFWHRWSLYVASLSKTLYLLRSSGSTSRKTGNRLNMTEKLLTGTSAIKTNKQTNKTLTIMFQLAKNHVLKRQLTYLLMHRLSTLHTLIPAKTFYNTEKPV